MTAAAERYPVTRVELSARNEGLSAYVMGRESCSRMAIHATVPVPFAYEFAPYTEDVCWSTSTSYRSLEPFEFLRDFLEFREITCLVHCLTSVTGTERRQFSGNAFSVETARVAQGSGQGPS